jgi:glutamate synthase domain-containing protein 2
MRKLFVIFSIISLATIILGALYNSTVLWFAVLWIPICGTGVYDMLQTHHTILRNFPVIGHIRYLMEFIAPELHQYFVENDVNGLPFSRIQRNYVYKRAKKKLETHPFGTELNVYQPGYYWLAHSMYPLDELADEPRVVFGGPQCTKPYNASIFNISAMSYGALGKKAVEALNKAAKLGSFFQNTGEGGISPYHLKHKGDLVWQIGTGYFGCRNNNGDFSYELFKENATIDSVKMVEIKLSQGAKPGLGGVLPAVKNTPEIANIRKIRPYELVHSPPAHQAFSNPKELLQFISKLRELSGGKPVGFKFCVGSRKEFIGICEAMIDTGMAPDFITVDGGEGGTGAAPVEFSDNVGMPLEDGLVFVVDALRGYDLKKNIKVIASCKVITGFDIIKYLAIGADACNSARGMMFALGCIQALECDSNTCPAGITTHKKHLEAGLDISDKAVRVANYHREVIKSTMAMLTAAGLNDLSKMNRSYIYKRVDNERTNTLNEIYPEAEAGSLLEKVRKHGEPMRYHSEGKVRNKKMNVNTQSSNTNYPKKRTTNDKNES